MDSCTYSTDSPYVFLLLYLLRMHHLKGHIHFLRKVFPFINIKNWITHCILNDDFIFNNIYKNYFKCEQLITVEGSGQWLD